MGGSNFPLWLPAVPPWSLDVSVTCVSPHGLLTFVGSGRDFLPRQPSVLPFTADPCPALAKSLLSAGWPAFLGADVQFPCESFGNCEFTHTSCVFLFYENLYRFHYGCFVIEYGRTPHPAVNTVFPPAPRCCLPSLYLSLLP